MKLWLLEALNPQGGPWLTRYDCYYAHVIRAESEAAARAMAPHGDEGADAWTDEKQSSCTELHPSGEACVVISDFNAG